MIIIIVFLILTIGLCFLIFLGIKNIDYLHKFKENSIETIARIKYIDEIGHGDSRYFIITVVFYDENDNQYILEKKEYVLENYMTEEDNIRIRYQKSNPKEWDFAYKFKLIEKP